MLKKNISVSMLVVLYGCDFFDSITVRNVIDTVLSSNKMKLVIWNNGPVFLEIPKDLIDVKNIDFIQTVNNLPLSVIYNKFIKSYDSDFYVILDHDSDVSSEYVGYIKDINDQLFIGLPKITMNGIPRSPCVDGIFTDSILKNNSNLTAIGSGIILSRNAIEQVYNKYLSVFDENYALYGVDSSFFYRLRKLNLANKCSVTPGFEHSLSRFEVESADVKRFRLIERSIDFGLTLRYYPRLYLYKILIVQILKSLLGMESLSIIEILKAIFRGKHTRC